MLFLFMIIFVNSSYKSDIFFIFYDKFVWIG